jgi:hypothetical protein
LLKSDENEITVDSIKADGHQFRREHCDTLYVSHRLRGDPQWLREQYHRYLKAWPGYAFAFLAQGSVVCVFDPQFVDLRCLPWYDFKKRQSLYFGRKSIEDYATVILAA